MAIILKIQSQFLQVKNVDNKSYYRESWREVNGIVNIKHFKSMSYKVTLN